ncbi:hypothetical protein ACFQV2_35750 [Actinokineospora soli]|uniref:Uncharacterized protein n=1 Tax=Actinokineospora soli TaxID=1048753 RepID=A0ABW2TW31_9PSEU
MIICFRVGQMTFFSSATTSRRNRPMRVKTPAPDSLRSRAGVARPLRSAASESALAGLPAGLALATGLPAAAPSERPAGRAAPRRSRRDAAPADEPDAQPRPLPAPLRRPRQFLRSVC